ncbi:ankyrin repeat domain-containing protein, partial [Bdellovibrionota bacterium FG-1]
MKLKLGWSLFCVALNTLVFAGAILAAESSVDQESLNKSLRQEAMGGVIPRIEQLIRRGANINGQAAHGETALEYAIWFGRWGAALKLIELGANPNLADDSGRTPLLRAAGECNASRVVEALLRAGAKVNHYDLYGKTALINAARADCARTVAVMLLR